MRLAPLALLTACGAGCGGASIAPPGSATPRPAPAPGAVARYFPLEDGHLYAYTTSQDGETGMLVARVRRTDAAHGELVLSNGRKRFVFRPDAVAYDGGATILKAPLEVGARWPGEHGGTTRVTSVDAEVKVPAGHYRSCVETTEEGGRLPGSRYVTTYCPDVGMVRLIVSAAGTEARAELKSYGMPVSIQ